MRILVYPHDMAIGGSQLNAIDLAAALQQRGHDVLVYGQQGPLVARVEKCGLEFVESPSPSRRPSPTVVNHLACIARGRKIDVLHGYEWPPGLECYLAGKRSGAVAVTTVMSMAVAPFLPRTMPIIVGTEQIAAKERIWGRPAVSVLEPPIDIQENAPHADVGMEAFRGTWIDDDRPTLVCVTRLVAELKLEGLLTAIRSVGLVNRVRPLRMLVVGDGSARDVVTACAARVNAEHGSEIVTLTGELADPRAAYASADIALGMGGSVLRAMAFAKPVIVQGEGGFFRLLTAESAPDFRWTGWYGVGGSQHPAEALSRLLLDLLDNPARSLELGSFARSMVEREYSLTTATVRQEALLFEAVDRGREAPLAGIRSTTEAVGRFGFYHLRRRWLRLLGRAPKDDFNAKPVALRGPLPTVRLSHGSTRPAWLWFPGVRYDAVEGTDRHLAREIARSRPVIWVEPPVSWRHGGRVFACRPRVSLTDEGVLRVETSRPPGVSRPVLRLVARWLVQRSARIAVRQSGMALEAVLVSTPEQVLPTWTGDAVRVYFETDDFVAGGSLMGHSTDYLRESRRRNLARSEIFLGVTSEIVATVGAGAKGHVLPNGCDAERLAPAPLLVPSARVTLAPPMAGVIGQLNERLNLAMLEAVVDSGVSLLLVGPRCERSRSTGEALDRLITRSGVQWIDRVPQAEIPEILASLRVGLTPYTRTAFNDGSFPLKTLEYLAAGLPVVSSDLPSARRLGCDDIILAASPIEFGGAVADCVGRGLRQEDVLRRQAFARHHSWQARASDLTELVAEAASSRRTVDEPGLTAIEDRSADL